MRLKSEVLEEIQQTQSHHDELRMNQFPLKLYPEDADVLRDGKPLLREYLRWVQHLG